MRAKVAERQQRLREATGRLALAWLLASACLSGHLAHLWPAAPRLLHLLGSAPVHAAMSALAMLGALPLRATDHSAHFLLLVERTERRLKQPPAGSGCQFEGVPLPM